MYECICGFQHTHQVVMEAHLRMCSEAQSKFDTMEPIPIETLMSECCKIVMDIITPTITLQEQDNEQR